MHAILKELRAQLVLRPAERDEVVLVQKRIFLLPTAAGMAFGGMLTLMLAGSINYDLALGLALTFLLASLAVTALLHTFRNLAHLRVMPARTSAVFAGDTAHFAVAVRNTGPSQRYSIGVTCDRRDMQLIDIGAASMALARVAVPAERRGRLRPGPFTLLTRFPLGLFQAWAYVELDASCLVYPRPAPAGLPLPAPRAHREEGLHNGDAQDDFFGLREYQAGDSPRRIAWKAAARGHALLTKQFAGGGAGELWLTLETLPATLHIEERLSQLARWVLEAHAQGLAYGLELPGTRVPVGTGTGHRDRCLEALTLFDPSPRGASSAQTGAAAP
jgi:uncharacterized protein (DUF58 family)